LTNNGADISLPSAFLFVNVCELPVCDAEAVAVAVEADAPEIYNQHKTQCLLMKQMSFCLITILMEWAQGHRHLDERTVGFHNCNANT